MEFLHINKILNREQHVKDFKNYLTSFEDNRNNINIKKGIYIYGTPGSGKTEFVISILKELNYDIIKYDAGDFRNKSIVDTISKDNMSDKNIMSLFYGQIKRIAIIMDEIDGMNNGDKGGINSLIKLIRQKKTKKQKLEEESLNPIICIGNYHIDKKIKELMKVCNNIELKKPTNTQVSVILKELLSNIDDKIVIKLIEFFQGDLRKINNFYKIYKNKEDLLNLNLIENIFHINSYNDDTKNITLKLLNNKVTINDHNILMNETDRTIVGLLWHENIVDLLSKHKPAVSIPFYTKQLDNICFSDYIDRITFQKQIWQFNEMSSLIKTFKNNKLYHDTFNKHTKYNPSELRFTKVLTKYSTEYNNYNFIQHLCQELGMDKKDLFGFFEELQLKYNETSVLSLFENYEINKLDITRIYKYIEKNNKLSSSPDIENDDENSY